MLVEPTRMPGIDFIDRLATDSRALGKNVDVKLGAGK